MELARHSLVQSYRSTPELPLTSGDFESVQSPYAAIPPAPRAPVFARHAKPAFSWDPRNDPRAMAAPPPPGSLAPVAMGQYGANATGSIRAQIVEPEPRSKAGWGIMIAVVGAVLGGALGIMLNSNAAAAAAAANAPDAQQQMAVAAAQPPAQVAPQQPAMQAPVQAPQMPAQMVPLQPQPIAHAAPPPAKEPAVKEKETKATGGRAVMRTHRPIRDAVVRNRPVLATAVPEPVEQKPPRRASEEKEKKTEKAEKPEKKTADTSAAVDLLKQANKETSLSLGGSK